TATPHAEPCGCPSVLRRGLGDLGQGRARVELGSQVADAQDADRLTALDDRDTPDRLLAHDAHDVVVVVVGPDGQRVEGGELAHGCVEADALGEPAHHQVA